MLHLKTHAGKLLQLRCIRKGDQYGLNYCLVHDKDDPIIEFTDASPAEAGEPGSGQERVVRYGCARLLSFEGDAYLWLFGADVAWRQGKSQIQQMVAWIRADCPD